MLNFARPMRPDNSLSANELGANSNPLAANSAPGCKHVADHGVLAHLGTDALDLHTGIFWEEVTVDDEQLGQVEGGGGPLLSAGEGLSNCGRLDHFLCALHNNACQTCLLSCMSSSLLSSSSRRKPLGSSRDSIRASG